MSVVLRMGKISLWNGPTAEMFGMWKKDGLLEVILYRTNGLEHRLYLMVGWQQVDPTPLLFVYERMRRPMKTTCILTTSSFIVPINIYI
jgi:hypothetical protein